MTGVNGEISVDQGQAAVIPLPAIDSYPDPTVTWRESSTILSNRAQRHHITLSNHLVVLETRFPEDNDKQYRASALNSFAAESANTQVFTLKVRGEKENWVKGSGVMSNLH